LYIGAAGSAVFDLTEDERLSTKHLAATRGEAATDAGGGLAGETRDASGAARTRRSFADQGQT
jgi:hypothetical protein